MANAASASLRTIEGPPPKQPTIVSRDSSGTGKPPGRKTDDSFSRSKAARSVSGSPENAANRAKSGPFSIFRMALSRFETSISMTDSYVGAFVPAKPNQAAVAKPVTTKKSR